MKELGSAWGESLCSEDDPFLLQYGIIHVVSARSSDQVFDNLLFSIFDKPHYVKWPSFTVHSQELQKRKKMEPADTKINSAMVRLVRSFSFLLHHFQFDILLQVSVEIYISAAGAKCQLRSDAREKKSFSLILPWPH